MRLFRPDIEKMKANRDIEGLVKTLKDEDDKVRANAAEALKQIGPPAVDGLIRALKYESKVGWEAVWTLGEIGDKKAIEALTSATEDKDSRVRESAARALKRHYF